MAATLVRLQAAQTAKSVQAACSKQQTTVFSPSLRLVSRCYGGPSNVVSPRRHCNVRPLASSVTPFFGQCKLLFSAGAGTRGKRAVQMSYSYGSSESEEAIQKWTLLQVRGWILSAFAATFLVVPGYVFNEVLPALGKLFSDPRGYPAVWSYGQQAAGAVRHLPTLTLFAGALFFSSSVMDILIARARSHEALKFKVMGDLIASAIVVAYLTLSVIWNHFPRSDLALVILYLLRGLWDLRIWFEESYAD